LKNNKEAFMREFVTEVFIEGFIRYPNSSITITT
jgi:hypothetical protein